MDLAAEAGVDVSDWANFAGGPERAATNPRYCYEWSFVQPRKVVVLNLWQSNMLKRSGRIVQQHNFLEGARSAAKTNWKTRNRKMNFAVATAWSDRLPVRVIICDGRMRDRHDPLARASEVTARELDPIPWAVTEYDEETGAVTVTRGAKPPRPGAGKRSARRRHAIYPDELFPADTYEEGARKKVIVNAYERDPRARRECLRFFGYRCAACDLLFSERYGSLGENFIHVHHVRAISRRGKGHRVDPSCDLVPVCPNCHAMLHQNNPPMSVDRLRDLLDRVSKRAASTRLR